MGRGQLKGIWGEERTVFSTEDMNDPFDRERLSYPFSLQCQREKAISIWEEMGSRAQVEVVAIVQRRFTLSIKEARRSRWVWKQGGS